MLIAITFLTLVAGWLALEWAVARRRRRQLRRHLNAMLDRVTPDTFRITYPPIGRRP